MADHTLSLQVTVRVNYLSNNTAQLVTLATHPDDGEYFTMEFRPDDVSITFPKSAAPLLISALTYLKP